MLASSSPGSHSADLKHANLVYNTLWRNPFQANTRAIDFTAHRQVREQAEAQARAEAEALAAQAQNRHQGRQSLYDRDGLSGYAPTGLAPASEVPPPGGSVFIPARTRRRNEMSRVRTDRRNDYAAATHVAEPPVMYRRDTGSIAPSFIARSRAETLDFPAKGW